MKIRNPYIDKESHFRYIIGAYDAMADAYNSEVKEARSAGDMSRNVLRSAHRHLFLQLVNMAAADYNRLAKDYEDADESFVAIDSKNYSVVVGTNRVSLANRMKISPSTAYRLIMRLMDAGIIVRKDGHGSARPFDLYIAPGMIPVSDYNDRTYDALADIWQWCENPSVRGALRSICTQIDINRNSFNNEIIPEQQKESAPRILERNNVPEQKTGTQEAGERGELSYGEKIQQQMLRIDMRRKRYAVKLVTYVLAYLFKDRNIFPGEVSKSYDVAEWYFRDAANMSVKACDIKLEEYRQRLELVARWKVRNQGRPGAWKWDNIWPARYLDPENYRSGFIMTEKWLKKNDEYQKYKEFRKLLKKEEAMLQNQLERLMKYRNVYTYNNCCRYLQQYAPKQLEAFRLQANPIIFYNKS